MLRIKVLGPGCARCHKLEQTVKDAVEELAIDTEIEHIKDIKKIMEYPILTTPGLVINDKVVCSGQVPTKVEICTYITTAVENEEIV